MSDESYLEYVKGFRTVDFSLGVSAYSLAELHDACDLLVREAREVSAALFNLYRVFSETAVTPDVLLGRELLTRHRRRRH
jgi:hypothetical protein